MKFFISFLSLASGLFLFQPSAFANNPAHSAQLVPNERLSTVPYRTSFVLYSQYFRQIPIFQGDRPNTGNCIRSFTIPTACPIGYAMTISGSLSGGGGTSGKQTSNSVQGFGLKYLNVTTDMLAKDSTISYCAYTFYGKKQGNANKAWLSYTIYCNGRGAANTTQS